MKNQLLSVSPNLFKALSHFDQMQAQANVIIAELRDLKELLRLQNEQGRDTELLTADEAAARLQVTVRTLSACPRPVSRYG